MFRYMWKIMKYTDVDTHIYAWMRARVCVCVYATKNIYQKSIIFK